MSGPVRIVYSDLYARRGFTSLRRTWNRYHLARHTFGQTPLPALIPVLPAPAATEADLLRVHDSSYVDYIQTLDLTGEGKLDASTPAWHGMYARAERVVGGTLLGADLIASGRALHVFNPAGGQHHAHADRGGGFCVFNDVVAAVRRFQDAGMRPAVIDLDGHHGDGTQSLLEWESVPVLSLHQYGERTYPGTGAGEEIGMGTGRGYTLNLPLARGTGDEAYWSILQEIVAPSIRRYRPDVLIVQYGTDGHAADPLLKLRLSTALYARMAHWLHDLAHTITGGRLLIVGGGGYDPEHVVRCWMLLFAALAGLPQAHVHPDAASWLAETVPASDPNADAASLDGARRAGRLVELRPGAPDPQPLLG